MGYSTILSHIRIHDFFWKKGRFPFFLSEVMDLVIVCDVTVVFCRCGDSADYMEMRKMKNKIQYDPATKELICNGKKYRPGKEASYKKDQVEHRGIVTFVEVNEAYEKKKEFVMKKLMENIPPETIAREVVTGMTEETLSKIYGLLQKKDAKIKRHNGCFGLMIKTGKKVTGKNSAYIQIFE